MLKLSDESARNIAARPHFDFLIVGRSIDQALFYGGPQVLASIDVEDDVRAGVQVFLAAYQPHNG